MTEAELRAVEQGRVCHLHKILLEEDGSCSDCELEIPAWEPPSSSINDFKLHSLPIDLIFWYTLAIGAVLYLALYFK